MAAWIAAIALLGCSVPVVACTGLVCVGGSLAAWRLIRDPAHRNTTVAVLVCVAAVSGSIALRLHAVTTGTVAALATEGVTVTAEITLTGDPKVRHPQPGLFHQDGIVVDAAVRTVQAGSTRLSVHTPVVVFGNGPEWRSLLPSQRLRVRGRLAEPTSPGLVAAFLLVRDPPKILTPPSSVHTVAGAFRAGLREAAGILPPDQRGLLPALVVGDVSRLDRQVDADLEEAGLSHLNAVSGANLAIVAGAALALCRLAGLPLAPRAAFAALAMIAFAVVARPSPSVLRALLMGLVAALALGTGRAKDGVAALSAAVLLLILFVPELAHSFGFALSVTATAGILLLGPRWRARLTGDTATPPATRTAGDPAGEPPRHGARPVKAVRSDGAVRCLPVRAGRVEAVRPGASAPATRERRGRCPQWMAEAVVVPAAAQVAVTPVLVLMSGEISLVAVPANLLAGPAVAPATLLGFVAALVAPFWPEAAQVLVVPAGYAVGWIIMVSRWASGVPLSGVSWPQGIAGIGLLAVVAVVAVVVLRRRAWRAVALAVTGGALIAVLAIKPMTAPWPPAGWVMVMCDVGQGDGLVIAAGPGQGVVVDAGPDPVVMDRCLRRLGVRDVPLVILTHPHADHIDGLAGVHRDRRVGAVVTSPHRPSAPQSVRLSADLARRRVPEQAARPGTRWRLGPSEVTVVAPDATSAEEGPGEGSAANNASIVLHVRWRSGSALLSGDIESEAQERLLRGALPQADVLKVPHHGSPRQVPAFFAAVRARAALVSVGADNDYGHPAPSTLGLLHRLGMRVHRTDRSGDLAVIEGEGGLAVVSRGS
ncbi:ComEC/Rec2 family competence protein [Nonomuraea sp. MCN248]|uniref:ComEC/Rec2 family competence protein n=1 Tax=Nonomuraea corallina TaxID=2989783 RepID=A0ABT4SCM1_9ACTN|nr:ComEC/Rec2 family competence protein [Nonomuraea corallina]MDA0634944.1 ComEC/Rec2 family competence protein [Nonomuraea corallina]